MNYNFLFKIYIQIKFPCPFCDEKFYNSELKNNDLMNNENKSLKIENEMVKFEKDYKIVPFCMKIPSVLSNTRTITSF